MRVASPGFETDVTNDGNARPSFWIRRGKRPAWTTTARTSRAPM